MKEANRRLVGAGLALLGIALVFVLWRGQERGSIALLGEEIAASRQEGPATLAHQSALEVAVNDPDASAQSVDTRLVAAQRSPNATESAASEASACTVFGRVVDQERRALADVPVRLFGYRGWAAGHDVPRLPGKYDFRGWEVRTDEAGAFRFAVPVPTIASVQFRIEPIPLLDSVSRDLGGDKSDALPRLHAGENDLGTFLLVATGVIRGRVASQSGEPIAEAWLRISNDPWDTLEREGESDASGSYEIAHIKPGTYGVAVDREGFLSAFAKPFVVETGRATDGADFVLAVAPTLRGQVVDEEGRPLAGARLSAQPANSGTGGIGRSSSDGTFEIWLPQVDRHYLEVELAGYVPIRVGAGSTAYEPGVNDIVVVLHRATTPEFPLPAGATVSGRVFRSANPAAASVELRTVATVVDGPGKLAFRANSDTVVRENTDREGRFRIAGVLPGTYQLVARATDGACVELVPLEVPPSGDVDVGDLVLKPGAAIRGRVLLPPGRSAAGLVVAVDAWQNALDTETDAEGRFRFDALLPGDHRLSLGEQPGRVTGLEARIRLESGETREVELDARENGTCDVALTLELCGAPAEGYDVSLMPADRQARRHELGTTDAAGRVSGWAPAWGRARVELTLADYSRLVHPQPLEGLALDANVAALVRFEVGELRIALPPLLALPPESWVRLALASAASEKPIQRSSSIAEAVDGVLSFANVLPGEYELTFTAGQPVRPGDEHPPAPLVLYESSARASVAAGAATRIELR